MKRFDKFTLRDALSRMDEPQLRIVLEERYLGKVDGLNEAIQILDEFAEFDTAVHLREVLRARREGHQSNVTPL